MEVRIFRIRMKKGIKESDPLMPETRGTSQV